jgi:hypothetical protein
MAETKIRCEYCFTEKLPSSIFTYKHDGVDRSLCSDCKVAGKHWGTYKHEVEK